MGGFDLAPYFPQGALPCCPFDPEQEFVTSYTLSEVEYVPECDIVPQTHILEEPPH